MTRSEFKKKNLQAIHEKMMTKADVKCWHSGRPFNKVLEKVIETDKARTCK